MEYIKLLLTMILCIICIGTMLSTKRTCVCKERENSIQDEEIQALRKRLDTAIDRNRELLNRIEVSNRMLLSFGNIKMDLSAEDLDKGIRDGYVDMDRIFHIIVNNDHGKTHIELKSWIDIIDGNIGYTEHKGFEIDMEKALESRALFREVIRTPGKYSGGVSFHKAKNPDNVMHEYIDYYDLNGRIILCTEAGFLTGYEGLSIPGKSQEYLVVLKSEHPMYREQFSVVE